MKYRLLLAGLLLVLAGCRGAPVSGPEGGAVVFVDAAGNRMQVEMPAANPAGPAPVVPASPASPAADLPQAADGDSAARAFDGESYVDVDAYERSVEQREQERFYPIPLPDGGRAIVPATALGVATPETASGGQGAGTVAGARLRACPPGVRIEHLLAVEQPANRHDLAFPVFAASYTDSRRYAGYRLRLPAGVRSLRVQGMARRGSPPDVVVALLDNIGQVTSVVNNIATESIPESLFSYARVGTYVVVPPVLERGGWVAVLEGGWARKVLPASCGPGEPSGSAVSGHVTVEYTNAD